MMEQIGYSHCAGRTTARKPHQLTLLPEKPINSNSRMTRPGSIEIIRLNVPTPIRTPLSKCVFDSIVSHCLFSRMWLHSLQMNIFVNIFVSIVCITGDRLNGSPYLYILKQLRILMPPLIRLVSVSSSMNVNCAFSNNASAEHSSACASISVYCS